MELKVQKNTNTARYNTPLDKIHISKLHVDCFTRERGRRYVRMLRTEPK